MSGLTKSCNKTMHKHFINYLETSENMKLWNHQP